ncbi:MAG: hypothetical protein JXA01_03045 [Dehalococcoidia bacterium]|nr:hypothetical protein [Dehalococcoidia bacterium]
MIQNFQCPGCGNLVALGEPACSHCGQFFKYNCPVCGNPVDNRYIRCGSCNTLFNWSKSIQYNPETSASTIQQARVSFQNQQQANIQYTNTQQAQVQNQNTPQGRVQYSNAQQTNAVIKEAGDKTSSTSIPLTSRPIFWLVLMISCAVLIAILLFAAKAVSG